MIQMKPIKWSLLATAALASFVLSVTIQQQNVAAFNEENNQFVSNFRNHLKCDADECGGTSGVVSNDESQHSNTNCNSNSNSPGRDEQSCRTNSHDKPDNDD
jgi:hypothetical protein